ncbi:MHYT domain-containing protein [Frigidibacter sp. MR17.24]|uniref:MHYT domain-containing protein n=1 Tax=Frigidibacter sp. MR17.24 TaxID=3127345 RepID=UPI003013015B
MLNVLSCISVQHDPSLVVIAALLCAFGSWAMSRLYRHARHRGPGQSALWYLMTATTAGVSIWCTHFVAMLGFQPQVPVSFDLALTVISLVVAIVGSAVAIAFAATVRLRFAPAIGGALLGLAISGMHYSGMIAYRVQGLVSWDHGYLVTSILLAAGFSALAMTFGSRDDRRSELWMALSLTLGIVGLHFTGMTAFRVAPLALPGDYSNPAAFKMLALAIAGIAALVVMGGLFAYAVEIRTRMESITELTAARNAAEAASRAKSEFMSVLSHELRTPLTIVLGYAGIMTGLKQRHAAAARLPDETLDLHLRQMGDQAELYGQKITQAANNLLALINQILDYTNMELGDSRLSRAPFALADLLADADARFRPLALARGMRITVEADATWAHADRGRCDQVLANLIDNALKFSKADTLVLRARRTDTGLAIEVEDNGRGIAEADLERIFLAFQQLENADNRHEGGTGLGLAICRKIALAHGGELTVTSRPGAGARFTLSLPQDAVAAPQDAAGSEAPATPLPQLRLAG